MIAEPEELNRYLLNRIFDFYKQRTIIELNRDRCIRETSAKGVNWTLTEKVPVSVGVEAVVIHVSLDERWLLDSLK